MTENPKNTNSVNTNDILNNQVVFSDPSEEGTQENIKKVKEKKENVKKNYSLKSMIDLVKYPVLTEKTAIILSNNRQYTFDVDKSLTKTQIKKLFESLFEVNVISVNTHIPPRRTVRVGIARGYRPLYKRAIITLKENQTINYNINSKK